MTSNPRTHCPKLTRQLPAIGPMNTAALVWELYHGEPVVESERAFRISA